MGAMLFASNVAPRLSRGGDRRELPPCAAADGATRPRRGSGLGHASWLVEQAEPLLPGDYAGKMREEENVRAFHARHGTWMRLRRRHGRVLPVKLLLSRVLGVDGAALPSTVGRAAKGVPVTTGCVPGWLRPPRHHGDTLKVPCRDASTLGVLLLQRQGGTPLRAWEFWNGMCGSRPRVDMWAE
eukprot:GHVU01053908.1.p2 GENE.GHVU01053908.1~~GHVU01053908.1.p2  ORF type:complete len:184 (+),score=20.59 GHVU01053908.1:216-767(+)